MFQSLPVDTPIRCDPDAKARKPGRTPSASRSRYQQNARAVSKDSFVRLNPGPRTSSPSCGSVRLAGLAQPPSLSVQCLRACLDTESLEGPKPASCPDPAAALMSAPPPGAAVNAAPATVAEALAREEWVGPFAREISRVMGRF